ncbi:hypothetical protein MSPP1_001267 [Malassezia sp. CBS 17886]|nr:hypothetical protein MSPP1_001267 [Malassezia sp. CBS 17886]
MPDFSAAFPDMLVGSDTRGAPSADFVAASLPRMAERPDVPAHMKSPPAAMIWDGQHHTGAGMHPVAPQHGLRHPISDFPTGSSAISPALSQQNYPYSVSAPSTPAISNVTPTRSTTQSSVKRLNWAEMICYTISESPLGRLVIQELFEGMCHKFPDVREWAVGKDWEARVKNRIKSTLSIKGNLFVKVPRPSSATGKGSWWTLSAEAQEAYRQGRVAEAVRGSSMSTSGNAPSPAPGKASVAAAGRHYAQHHSLASQSHGGAAPRSPGVRSAPLSPFQTHQAPKYDQAAPQTTFKFASNQSSPALSHAVAPITSLPYGSQHHLTSLDGMGSPPLTASTGYPSIGTSLGGDSSVDAANSNSTASPASMYAQTPGFTGIPQTWPLALAMPEAYTTQGMAQLGAGKQSQYMYRGAPATTPTPGMAALSMAGSMHPHAGLSPEYTRVPGRAPPTRSATEPMPGMRDDVARSMHPANPGSPPNMFLGMNSGWDSTQTMAFSALHGLDTPTMDSALGAAGNAHSLEMNSTPSAMDRTSNELHAADGGIGAPLPGGLAQMPFSMYPPQSATGQPSSLDSVADFYAAHGKLMDNGFLGEQPHLNGSKTNAPGDMGPASAYQFFDYTQSLLKSNNSTGADTAPSDKDNSTSI